MKVYYKKNCLLKFFGIKIFEFKTNYIERSTDKEDDNDDFLIDLNGKILSLEGEK